eukprot:4906881-Pleurochrysis_carterae.AAC.1
MGARSCLIALSGRAVGHHPHARDSKKESSSQVASWFLFSGPFLGAHRVSLARSSAQKTNLCAPEFQSYFLI